MEAEAILVLGSLQYRLGVLDEATLHLQKAVHLYETVTDYIGQVEANGELGLCYLRQGHLEQALSVLETAHQLMQDKNLIGHQSIPCLIGLTAAYLAAAEADQSQQGAWLKKAARTCRAALRQSRYCRPWLPHALRLQGQYEWLKGKPQPAQRHWQESLEVAAEMGARYEVGMTHLEMGRYLRARVHLEQARDIFAALEAKWDWAQAQSLLEQ